MKTMLKMSMTTLFALSLAAAMPETGCGGDEFDPEFAYDDDEATQDLTAPSLPAPVSTLAVKGADLVGEVVGCTSTTVTYRIRNRGDVATDAWYCSLYCWPQFRSWLYNGSRQVVVWTDNLAPGETSTVTIAKPAGLEGRVWIAVDVGGPDGAVEEYNENNNFTESNCVL